MKVLYISYDGLTDALGQSQIIPYLKGCGVEHEITVLSVEKKEAFGKRSGAVEKLLNESGIRWEFIWYSKNPPLLSTFLDIWKLKRKAGRIIRSRSIRLVHSRSYVAGYVAACLQEKYGIKWLFDIRGFWADERMDGGIWKTSNPVHVWIYNRLKRLERRWFETTDHIISLTEKGKDEIVQRLAGNIRPDKITVIPCCTDTAIFDPQSATPKSVARIKLELGIKPDERSLCYLGSTGTWYLADEMFEQFIHLKSKGIVDKFVWLTNDVHAAREVRKKHDLNEVEVIILEAERSQVPAYLSAIDIGLFYIRNAYSKMASSPTKLGEFLAMGKPVICNPIGDLESFFRENKVGICRRPEEMLESSDIEQITSINPMDIRQVALKELGLETGVKRYLETYRRLS